jgi:glycosyltransferase involved in cell wall biosynthesis
VGGIPEWLVDGESGFLVEPRDVHAFGRALETLIGDSARCYHMGLRARELAKARFSLDRYVDDILVVFSALSRAS